MEEEAPGQSCEYLPMGICEDTEAKETYFFQIEHSGQWLVEYGSSMGKKSVSCA